MMMRIQILKNGWILYILNQVKSLTAAIAVPINQVITIFEGDPGKFKQWIKDIEKYAKMSDMNNEDIPKIAYVTCKGSVGDFIKRYLTEIEASGELPSWNDLKVFKKKISWNNRFTACIGNHEKDETKFQ